MNCPAPIFSTEWKIFFHRVEKQDRIFPWCGKFRTDFSMQWKTFFHGVEMLQL